MILIDTNALVILLIGFIDPRLFKTHKTTSIYEEQDFIDLLVVIGDIKRLVVLPNVWTELDNLLNKFSGNYKYQYIEQIAKTIQATTERYIESVRAIESFTFFEIGLTDTLLLHVAKECQLLVTSDSRLSDYAIALGIPVYDLVKNRNERI
ncbi:MAG: hypothetical protein M3342_14335 [Bacteroidota bacterium]|nr:hypothetical protein [Bacteroidota bacterium]